jgi:hypothetical protein
MPEQHTQSDDSVDETEPQTSRRRTIAVSCCAFLISYVITAGPAVFIVQKIDLPSVSTIAEIIYAPIILIVKSKIPILSGAIKLYLGLFQ